MILNKDLIITNTPESVAISIYNRLIIGTISTNYTKYNGVWYLNRLLVNQEYRGKGIGPQLIRRLQWLLAGDREATMPQCTSLIVEPSGYGSDPIILHEFYARYDFKEHGTYMEWNT